MRPNEIQRCPRHNALLRAAAVIANRALLTRGLATAGIQGAGFVEAKDFTATTNTKGEWSVLGVTRGVWIFEASAAAVVPTAVVIPIHVTQNQAGWQINWRLSVPLIGLDELRASEGDGAAGGLALVGRGVEAAGRR
jgi:hypothetical protein